MKYNKLYIGLLVGLATVLMGYGIISLIFDGMVMSGMMDEAFGGDAYDKRQRTIWLISICCNIIGIQYFNKRKSNNVQRGIAIFTVLCAFIWFFYFKDSLLFLEG